ncbi:MAG: CPBP family intramembrane glutamic endopeptidase [Verrucomicrobiota bacterium]
MIQTLTYGRAAAAAMLGGVGGMLLLGGLVEGPLENAPLWLQLLAGLLPLHICAFAAALAVVAADAGEWRLSPRLLRQLGFGASQAGRLSSPGFIAMSAAGACLSTALLSLACAALLEQLGVPVTGNPLIRAVIEEGTVRSWLALAFVGVIVAPPVEEFLFREVLNGAFGGVGAGSARRAAVLSAAAFAVIHGIPAQMPALFALALFLQWLRRRSGSLRAGTAVHAVYNFLAILVLALIA